MSHPAHLDQQQEQAEAAIEQDIQHLVSACLVTWKPSLNRVIRQFVVEQPSVFDRLDADGKRSLRESLDDAILNTGSQLEKTVRQIAADELARSGSLRGGGLERHIEPSLKDLAKPVSDVLFKAGFRHGLTSIGFDYEIQLELDQPVYQGAAALQDDLEDLRQIRREIAGYESSDQKDRVANEWDAFSGQ